MTLYELDIGGWGRIQSVGGEGALRRRLMDMGLTPGTLVHIRRCAPLGDPIEIRVRGYALSLRREDTKDIAIEPLVGYGTADRAACEGCPGCGAKRRRKFRGGRQ